MNTPAWPFATLSAADVAQAEVAAACARIGITPQWGDAPTQGAMLRFDVACAAGRLQLAVAADDWCPRMLPALSGLAWSALVDRDTLARWLPEGPLLALGLSQFANAEIRLHDVVPASLLVTARGRQPFLATAQGRAWIQQLQAAPVLRAADAAAHLQLAVSLEVARFSMPVQRLRSLTPGAVVLLSQFQPIARAGHQRLYTFDFTLETVSVNTPFDFLDEEGEPAAFDPASTAAPPAAPAPVGFDVARLPVTVEVVLCQLQQRVGELAALQPGTVFNLPPNAWGRLQLRVNGQTVAEGELVQVGDQLGVQLHQAPVLP